MYPKIADQLPTTTDGCRFNSSSAIYELNEVYLNTSSYTSPIVYEDENFFFKIFHIAFLLVPVSGFLISYVIGLIVSLLTGGLKLVNDVNPLHLNPIAWYIWPKSCVPLNKRDDFKVNSN